MCSSPGLIAAYHVLLRLSAPRHPPYTLSNLTALIPLPDDLPTGKLLRCASLHSGAYWTVQKTRVALCFNCRTTVLLPRVFPLTSRHPLFNCQRTTATATLFESLLSSAGAALRSLFSAAFFSLQLPAKLRDVLIRQAADFTFCFGSELKIFDAHHQLTRQTSRSVSPCSQNHRDGFGSPSPRSVTWS